MQSKKPSLLNPEEKDIKKYVEIFEEEWGFGDNLIYRGCLEAVKKIELYKIKGKDVKGPIRTFLINWGLMGRVLNRKPTEKSKIDRRCWERRLASKIRTFRNELDTFRGLNLENIDDISKYEKKIIECFNGISECKKGNKRGIGPVAAGKVLHLICPDFFPMWDIAIRERVAKDSGHEPIGANGNGYYKFMGKIQNFLKTKTYDSTLSEMSKKYKKSKIKIVDEFMFSMSRIEDYRHDI